MADKKQTIIEQVEQLRRDGMLRWWTVNQPTTQGERSHLQAATLDGMDNALQYFSRERQQPSTVLQRGVAKLFGGFFTTIDGHEGMRAFAETLPGDMGAKFLEYIKTGSGFGGVLSSLGLESQSAAQQRAFVQAYDRLMVGFLDARQEGIGVPAGTLTANAFDKMMKDETVTGPELAGLLERYGFKKDEMERMGPELATQFVTLAGGVLQHLITHRDTQDNDVSSLIAKRFPAEKFQQLISPAAQRTIFANNQGTMADLGRIPPAKPGSYEAELEGRRDRNEITDKEFMTLYAQGLKDGRIQRRAPERATNFESGLPEYLGYLVSICGTAPDYTFRQR